MSDPIEDAFDRLMDATQTLIQLQPGDVLTQEMIDDLHLVDSDHRQDFERASEAFHRGYEAGLRRGGGADTAKLIEERDEARGRASVANAISSAAEHWGFIKGAQICREMMARFVEQGGTETERKIACSIRANWRPSWGDDPGAPIEEVYTNAAPREVRAKEDGPAEILQTLYQYESDLIHPPIEGSFERRLQHVRSVIAKLIQEPADG